MSFVKRDLPKQVFPYFLNKSSTFVGDFLSILYETTPEAIAAIVPPGLRLRGGPFVEIGMNLFARTNFDVGYKEAALVICVTDEKHGIDGKYTVAMTLDTDMGTFLGREGNGFNKKIGHVGGQYEGNRFTGYAARHGVCYASMSADCDREPNDTRFKEVAGQFAKPMGDGSKERAMFNYLWPMGLRGRMKPLLNFLRIGVNLTAEVKFGFADVCLNWSKHDPWACLPVVKVLGGTVFSCDVTMTNVGDEYWTEIDSEKYLPYAFSDWDEPHIS